jgi:hypothetical protein
MYQEFEWDWNGDREYAAHVDRADLSWTAELRIPFATLAVQPPRPGDVWTMNIGRNQYGEKEARDKGGLVACYLWSPNIESRTFHDVSAFGELVFRAPGSVREQP